ncbi:hypothetical protein ABPG75_000602 [Micractinium tetrahymenae]
MLPSEPEVLHTVLASFPPVQHAFAYGSGVFKQPGLYDGHPEASAEGSAAAADAVASGSGDRPMLDFIFAVDDPVAWHTENLRRHAHHYSFLRHLGPAGMTAVAEKLGAGVYFNTLVPWAPHQLIKYGVVRLSALQADLLHWTTLYCAGRLHKPVATLTCHPGVAAAQEANLRSALRAALLLLPPRFDTLDLLHAICAISYSGDVRMGLAEDSRKVHRIVQGSEAGLRQLYSPLLGEAQQRWGALVAAGEAGGDAWAADDSTAAVGTLVAGLPAHVLQRLAAALGVQVVGAEQQQQQQQQQQRCSGTAAAGLPAWQQPPGLGAVAAALAARPAAQRARLLRHAIHAIVGASSRRQAVSGVLTAGVGKSLRYGVAKLRKAWR